MWSYVGQTRGVIHYEATIYMSTYLYPNVMWSYVGQIRGVLHCEAELQRLTKELLRNPIRLPWLSNWPAPSVHRLSVLYCVMCILYFVFSFCISYFVFWKLTRLPARFWIDMLLLFIDYQFRILYFVFCILYVVQGVFFNWYPPKSSKKRKFNLG